MRHKIIDRVALFLLQSVLLIVALRGFVLPQQTEPGKQQSNSYMDNFLLRDTKPLGLKGDRRLERLLRQPAVKWAIRAGARHILD